MFILLNKRLINVYIFEDIRKLITPKFFDKIYIFIWKKIDQFIFI